MAAAPRPIPAGRIRAPATPALPAPMEAPALPVPILAPAPAPATITATALALALALTRHREAAGMADSAAAPGRPHSTSVTKANGSPLAVPRELYAIPIRPAEESFCVTILATLEGVREKETNERHLSKRMAL